MPETLADQLEPQRDELDRLMYDLRLHPHPDGKVYDAFEERAQRIADAIVATFRGEKPPVAAPIALHVMPGRCRGLW